MNSAFYTASRAASTQQDRINIVANNFANVNTVGYKAKTGMFQELVNYNMRAPEGEGTNLFAGVGTVVDHTNTDFTPSAPMQMLDNFKYAIMEEGFFQVQNPITNEITYTRDGDFSLSQREDGFYLITDSEKLVLDATGQPILVEGEEISADPAVYNFENTDGMLSIGSNEFLPVEKNGQPTLIESPNMLEKYLEMSNVDVAQEMAYMIEGSRAYSYVLKMMQTCDEVQQTLNQLR